MYAEFPQPISPQPQLFNLEESIGKIELFPAIWGALEDLTKEDLKVRKSALQELIELDAARFSPVVAYILVTRVEEPNIELRAKIIETLGLVLLPDKKGFPAPDDIRSSLYLYLSSYRTRQIFAMLQASAEIEFIKDHVERLLNASRFAGNHLIEILIDPKNPLEVRRQAVVMIGKVGYLKTLPALEKLAGRLEARIAGQTTMNFAAQSNLKDSELLPAVEEAVKALRTP
jgi:HEAT repeat protein